MSHIAARTRFVADAAVEAREYIVLTVAMFMRALAPLLAPVGINRLLRCVRVHSWSAVILTEHYGSYIESGGEGAVVRPWVWISFMFFGPFIGTMVSQWYIFTAVCFHELSRIACLSESFRHELWSKRKL